ncbi:MAG: hypothetical protein OXB99_08015 [Acidimicrobiaceae bacterium]|nr:hypothetical protein [Acidimicrobiaceae bacterium]
MTDRACPTRGSGALHWQWVGLLLILSALLAACADSEAGLTSAEVEEMVAAQTADALTEADVEDVVRRALAEMAQPAPGLTRSEVEEIVEAAVAGVPSESAPAEYTQHLVAEAISRYEAEGLDATLAHYNRAESVDGQWYVFIIDEDDMVIGHPDPERRGLDLKGWVGTDVNGYVFGSEMLAADEEGRWVPYVYLNPASGSLGDRDALELKNAWVIRHDGLLFGSGWYVNSEELLPELMLEAAGHFREGGLEAILEFYTDPQGLSAGLIPTVEYYNSTDTLKGYFSGFIVSGDGKILAHFDPALIGSDIEDLLGPAVWAATAEGAWITAADSPDGQGPETMRVFVINADGTLIGGGWYRN